MPVIEDLAGKWEPTEQGDPEAFMAAIGMGWLKRKAIAAGLALGFGSHGYDITVTKEEDGTAKIRIQDGKRDNTMVTDGSEFTYDGPNGQTQSTAKVEDGKLVMSSQSVDPPVLVITERWVDDDGTYITRLSCPEKGEDTVWVRKCVRAKTK